MSTSIARKAWQEPMLWLVALLPSAVVCASIVTLVLALRSNADATPSRVRRTAQVQIEDLSADRRSAALGLDADLSIDAVTGAVSLTLRGNEPLYTSVLELELIHPARAAEDRHQILVRSGSRWIGRLDPTAAHAWNLCLRSPGGGWRLHGRLAAGMHHARLRPAVEG